MIIGRTNLNAENEDPEKNINKYRYYFISHLSRDCLLKSNINVLPVCLNAIIKNYGWKVIAYSKVKKLNLTFYYDIMLNNLGFSEKTQDGEYIIFYDDSQSIGTQRFTISHEIGHILLSHFKYPTSSREKEANMFAARLLMPMCILYECKVKSPSEIMNMCNVSLITAEFRYKRLLIIKARNKFYFDKNEIKLKIIFKKYINSYLKNK